MKKLKGQQIQYKPQSQMLQNNSPIKTHLLSSVLPYQEIKNQQHFVKNKQFYKPQQFIWNNPHRTSKRLYPYYHQFNQMYQAKMKPIIDKLQEQDRINLEQQRIKKLATLRVETRQKFFQRQKSRQQLEAKSNSKKKIASLTEILPQSHRLQRNSHAPSLKINIPIRQHSNSSHILANIQKTYQKGVKKYQEELANIRKLVSQQVVKNHSKIRFEFQKRKQNNDVFNMSISKNIGRKSVGLLKHDNYFE